MNFLNNIWYKEQNDFNFKEHNKPNVEGVNLQATNPPLFEKAIQVKAITDVIFFYHTHTKLKSCLTNTGNQLSG